MTTLTIPAKTGSRMLRLGCEFRHTAEVPTPTIWQIQPADATTLSGEQWSFDPRVISRSYLDLYGNRCLRAVLPAGASTLRYDTLAEVPDATEDFDLDASELLPDELPDDVMIYTLPSRYCLPDLLGNETWARFGGLPRGYGRIQAICDYVNGHLQFAYGSSMPTSTAADVYRSGFGVCRDFTHLAISFVRALNTPARYVFGYLPDLDVPFDPAPMDFAAWMEVWLGDRWWTFDPRNNVRRKGRVVIGRGRDASDVAMLTTFGGPRLDLMTVWAAEVDPVS